MRLAVDITEKFGKRFGAVADGMATGLVREAIRVGDDTLTMLAGTSELAEEVRVAAVKLGAGRWLVALRSEIARANIRI